MVGEGGRLAQVDCPGRQHGSLKPREGAQALAKAEKEHCDQVGVRAGQN